MPFSAFYRRVPLTEHVEFDERDEKDSTWYQSTLGRRKPLSTYIFLSVLVLSVLLNAVALVFFMEATHCTLSSSSSRFGAIQTTALFRKETLISLSQPGFSEI